MTWVAAAIVGGSVIGGVISSQGAQSAAQTQANAATNAQGISQQEFNTITGQETPYMQGGYNALGMMEYGMGLPGTVPAPSTGGTSNTYQALSAGAGNNGQLPTIGPGSAGSAPTVSSAGSGISGGNGTFYNPVSGQRLLAGPSNSAMMRPAPNAYGGINGAVASATYHPSPAVAPSPSAPNAPSAAYASSAGGAMGQMGAGFGSLTQPFSAPSNVSPNAPGNGIGGYGSILQPFTTADWQQLSPAYNFQRQQGMQGTLNGDASMSGAMSGAAQKDLMGYNQNLANTSFNNAFNMYQAQQGNAMNMYNNAFNMYQAQQGNIYSRLAGLAQLGQSAAADTGQQGTALAGQASQSATNVGTALAAGQVGSANAYSGALQNMSYLPWLMSSGASGGAAASGFGMSGLSGY